ncbi:MAG: ATP-binding protein [Ruminococcus sp.]|nr:ATP-binding protein [Ruminococcus sp.]
MNDLEARMEKRRELNAKRGGKYVPYSLRQREKDLEEMQEKLGSSNCDLFAFGIYIYVAADTLEQLNDLKDYIKQVALRHQVVVDVLTGVPQQEMGLQSIMPFANPSKTKDGSYLGQPFYLPTDEVANLIPFSYRNNINPAGLIYGINQITNTPIIIDRTEEMNANGFTLGTSGSGKSVTTKAEFFAAAMKYTDDEFIIIDPENEYRPLAAAKNGDAPPFDAEIIRLSPNTDTYINIFDTDMTYSEDGASAVQMKVDFIMTFCEVVKGSALTAKERSVIDRCTKIVYMDYVLSDGDRSKLPNLTQFYEALKKQDEKEAADIALSLETYVTGSFNIFAHDTNIQYNKRFIIFDIFEMGNQLQTVGLMVLLEMLWQRVIQNKLRGIRTWVWTDEFSIMFNDDSSGIFRTGDFFEKVYKRIRKHGGVATGATQNISEVIKSKQAILTR